ncbi:ABC transporter substrate-binding protein [Prauserella endophytica]|uniref:ABC transporter substrate-binding protein n=1 Tax=Prauserella endophytica TaxID=1592324 RepID=A0ABY2S608_9PSEU|nr:ABC transporter substrate-binding protein [Prauserella endophytica]TKG70826.1 ABC transporter substrate-binding protein [Prauserella endophytica]
MSRRGRFLALALAAVLPLSACGGPAAGPADPGRPVAGGSARVLQITEPRGLDPAALSNEYVLTAFLGNALYGTLMVNDPKTGKIEHTMAEGFATTDGGATFELSLRPGLRFSDGSPLDAAAVKVNWDRLKDPATGSSYVHEASMIASTAVLDTTTLRVTMAEPVPNYAQAVVTSSLNWIASPKALRAGQRAFDEKPVGAGPFTLESWARQDAIELVRNPGYWDAPKPYLDRLTLRTSSDGSQRLNTVVSGGADVAIETNWGNLAKAREAGLNTQLVPLNGGITVAMNTRRAPFDDVRARRAVAAALDPRAMGVSVYNGENLAAPTLFTDSSPFHTDLPLARTDKAEAQRLFDELAAEGKPVSFTFTSGPTTEIRAIAENVQAQLSAFDNVHVEVKVVDITKVLALRSTYDFDMLVGSAYFADPETRLWTAFHGDSRRNLAGIDDDRLDAGLQRGRTATSTGERKAAYEEVQKRLIELVPAIFVSRPAPSVITGSNVGGVVQYGHGSLLPEELWIQP